MGHVTFRDRETGKLIKEKIYGKFFLEALYGSSIVSKLFSFFVLPLLAHVPFFSKLYGNAQKSPASQKKIGPFIEQFRVDPSEFQEPVHHFRSFNDFFIRKLKPECRPLAEGEDIAVLPADGRYLVFPDISQTEGFYVKGKKFDVRQLIRDEFLFEAYKRGAMVIARLCPTDYHRFHFPFECIPTKAKLINGPLYSVNPLALRDHITILNENKRMLTQLKTKAFRNVLFMEVGATFVGSIRQTYKPDSHYQKGDEKGYFEFGGSCLILFFQPRSIAFEEDLVLSSKEKIEVKGKMGQPLGRSLL